MAIRNGLALGLLAGMTVLWGCGDPCEKDPTAEGCDPDTDTDTGTDTDTDSNTEGTDPPPPAFEPYYLSIDGRFRYDPNTDSATGYFLTDGTPIPAYVTVSLAEEAWPDAGFDDRYECLVFFEAPDGETAYPVGEDFSAMRIWGDDLNGNNRPDDNEISTYTYMGFTIVDPEATLPAPVITIVRADGAECNLDPRIWGDNLEDFFLAETFGIGVGEIEPNIDEYIRTQLPENNDWWIYLNDGIIGGGAFKWGKLADAGLPGPFLMNNVAFAFATDENGQILVDGDGNGQFLQVADWDPALHAVPPGAMYGQQGWWLRPQLAELFFQ